ncbi:MAG: sulfatase [Rhodothermales bacterium]
MRPFLLLAFLILTACQPASNTAERPPNLVIVFADDLGYGDLGTYGHPTIQTPHLDRMAAEGMKFTQFYVGAAVCTPSRAALLTGRLPVRSGMAGSQRQVLFPDSKLGLPADEITMAELLKDEGYATAAIGKWHLGHLPDFLPTEHGFDTYFGIPYSNDMDRTVGGPWLDANVWNNPQIESWNVPILRDTTEAERPANQHTITRRFTEETIAFMEANQDEPFFVYLAHSLPHVPLFTDDAFKGKSARGLYGDVIEEIDWSVGQIMQALEQMDLAENTLVVFTSDNGPWLTFREQGGSAGLLHEGKQSTWEGGMRVPMLAWWPGTIEPEVVKALGTTMDLFPTAADMAGALMPSDRPYDGASMLPLFTGQTDTIRDTVYYYRKQQLFAIRQGPWKAHFTTQGSYQNSGNYTEHETPLLFNLDHDPSEQYNLAEVHPDIVTRLTAAAEDHVARTPPAESQLEARIGEP